MGFFTDVSDAHKILNQAVMQVGGYRFNASDLDGALTTPDNYDDHSVIAAEGFNEWLQSVVSRWSWFCISKRTDLVLSSGGPIGNAVEYFYKYDVPSDLIRLNYLTDGYTRLWDKDPINPQAFVREGSVLYSNLWFNGVSYVYYPTWSGYTASDWNTYLGLLMPELRDTIIKYMAYQMAYPLKKDLSLKAANKQEYEDAFGEAKALDKTSHATEYPDNLGGTLRGRFSSDNRY